ncbi:MAG: hypothetical protein AAF351_04815 [Pseudomonadota bacterium]
MDLEQRSVRQVIDAKDIEIDWLGVGGDRGLRGIAFDADRIFIAASDTLFAYDQNFELLHSWQCPYLKYAQGMAIYERTLYIASAGFDTILGFHLDERRFHWAMQVVKSNYKYQIAGFDPAGDDGPLMLNKLHLNSVVANQYGLYIGGLRAGGMLHFSGKRLNMAVTLPEGSRDARPFRDGVVFNDTEAGALRYTGRGDGAEDRGMRLAEIDADSVDHNDAVREGRAKLGFARGLCVLSDSVVAGGSSPTTVTVYDLASNTTAGSVRISNDARSSVHSIAVWPHR